MKNKTKIWILASLVLFFSIFNTLTSKISVDIPLSVVSYNNNLELTTSDWYYNVSNVTVISDTVNIPAGWNDGNSFYPSVAIDSNGNLHVVWEDYTDGEWGSDTEIMYINYTASGWSNMTVISDIYGWNNGGSYTPDIAIDGNDDIHVVWTDSTNGEWGTDWEIMYSNNTGSGWTNASVISDDGTNWNDGSSLTSDIVIDKDNYIHVIWSDNTDGEWGNDSEIMYTNNTGASWTNATVVSDDYTGWNDDISFSPSFSSDNNGNLHVVWVDDTDGIWGSYREIMYANYTAVGWSNATVISSDGTAQNRQGANPDIVVDNNNVIHVVWADDQIVLGSDRDIMYANYTASGWSNYQVISDNTGWNDGSSDYPSIVNGSSGTLHVVWRDTTSGEWGTDSEIMYTNYTGSGWTNGTVISDNNTLWNNDYSDNPDMAVNSTGDLHVFWNDGTDGYWGVDPEIMYTSTQTSGWSEVEIVSKGEKIIGWNDDLSTNPSIATDNKGYIHAVWEDWTDGEWGTDSEIFYANYTANGWSNSTCISDIYGWNDGSSAKPHIAIDSNGNLHVVWYDDTSGEWGGGFGDYEIMYANRTASGWSNATVISDIYGWNNGDSFSAAIAIDNNGNLHVVWRDNTDGEWGTDEEIMYANYTASSWSNATCISDVYGWNNDTSRSPSIAIDNFGNIHAIWHDNTDGEWGTDYEIMYTNNSGSAWTNATVISDDITGWNDRGSQYGRIDVDNSGNLHVVWQDYTIGPWGGGSETDIMYANYTGSSWSKGIVISDDNTDWNDDNSWYTELNVDINGNIHVVWGDYTDGQWGSDNEIMYVNYTSSGWSNATVISDNNTLWNDGTSTNAHIDTDKSGKIHVVWYDYTVGEWGTDPEIMYFGIGDSEAPNISSVLSEPTNPNNLENVNITVNITENLCVDTVLINSNHSGIATNYIMDLLSGTNQNGYWNYTIPTNSAGTTITYSFWVNDTYTNTDTDGPYQYTISDGENPNLVLVSREPTSPGNLDPVNITAHIMDNVGINTVLISSNYTGTPTNYTMDQLSGTTQDGYWNYTIPAYPAGVTIDYSIWVNDTNSNYDTDGPYQYTILDNEDPNILSVSRDPPNPGNLDPVNVTVQITDNGGVNMVLINSNHTGTPSNYTMEQLSGTIQNGYWNYTIPAYPAGTTIIYSIWANDTNNNFDIDGPYQYAVSDSEDPNITSVLRDPLNPGNLDSVNISVHITDNVGVDTVLINSNHSGTPTNYTMDQLSGTIQDGYWNHTISAYPAGIKITYSIWANDTSSNNVIDGPYNYSILDIENPNIVSVSRDPNQPDSQDLVNITVHITDNVGVHTVLLISNHTGVFVNYSMDLLSGTIQDGYWNYTLPANSTGLTINYSIWVNDSSGNNANSSYYNYTIIDIEEPSEPYWLLALLGAQAEGGILSFLMSPLGLVIIGAVIVVSVISAITISKKGSKSKTKKSKKEPKSKIRKKGPKSTLPWVDKTDK